MHIKLGGITNESIDQSRRYSRGSEKAVEEDCRSASAEISAFTLRVHYCGRLHYDMGCGSHDFVRMFDLYFQYVVGVMGGNK